LNLFPLLFDLLNVSLSKSITSSIESINNLLILKRKGNNGNFEQVLVLFTVSSLPIFLLIESCQHLRQLIAERFHVQLTIGPRLVCPVNVVREVIRLLLGQSYLECVILGIGGVRLELPLDQLGSLAVVGLHRDNEEEATTETKTDLYQ
jgi:hypothetical protein